MNEEIKKLLYELPKTSYGQALKKYLAEQIEEINDVNSIETLEDAKGKQIALKTLNKIFSFLVDKPLVDKTKNPYI